MTTARSSLQGSHRKAPENDRKPHEKPSGQVSVLIVDDDDDVREMLAMLLSPWRMHVHTSATGRSAIEMSALGSYDVAVVDLMLPDVAGLDLVAALHRSRPEMQTIIFTGCPSAATEVAANRLGVYQYLRKPEDLLRLAQVVIEAAGIRRLQADSLVGALPAADVDAHNLPLLVGRDPAIQAVRRQINEAASCDVTVLIRGETGTGKDPVARSIHALSGRNAGGNFCKVNCPSIPESLFESEMFGFEKGAFTGAQKQRLGRFELADGGTIFLDEISLLPLSLQAKLLEVLEYKTFYRIGGSAKTTVDARIIAATNRPLEEMVDTCEFRADLYYRLGVFVIDLPPLRRRLGDIPLLVDHFVQKCRLRFGHACPYPPAQTMERFMDYPWPGNVRELESLVSRYAVSGDAAVLEHYLDTHTAPAAAAPQRVLPLADVERRAMKKALAETGWNQRQAAKLLGLSYSAFRRRLEKFGLQRPAFFEDPEQ